MRGKLWHGVCAAFGVAGSALSALFGGFDGALATLIVFMCIDFAMGLTVAAVFKVSRKSEGGSLSSAACYKGLCRKFATLAIVLVGARLDALMGQSYIRDAVVYCYLLNEGLSITENLALMGVPVPKVVREALDILKGRKE